jgi:alkanesulfonate monooxygenase SsuD/methylene tetrahydromethanopterin reductase-like flavin-dependent oxidoreductase (luciferase family)
MDADRISFGIEIPRCTSTDVASFARFAEDIGYDFVAAGEHVLHRHFTYSGFVALSAAGGATRRIRLVSTITQLPLYPAAMAAKMAAAADHAPGGRFELGVGGENPSEFEACGVPVSERGARTDEALEVVDRLLRGEQVTFRGRFNTLTDFKLDPAPLQRPRPPIWIAGRRNAAMRRAAHYGDVWLPYFYTASQLRRSIQQIETMSAENGGGPWKGSAATTVLIAPHADPKIAHEIAIGGLLQDFGITRPDILDRYIVAGTPSQCIERVHEFIDAGARHLLLQPIDSTPRSQC